MRAKHQKMHLPRSCRGFWRGCSERFYNALRPHQHEKVYSFGVFPPPESRVIWAGASLYNPLHLSLSHVFGGLVARTVIKKIADSKFCPRLPGVPFDSVIYSIFLIFPAHRCRCSIASTPWPRLTEAIDLCKSLTGGGSYCLRISFFSLIRSCPSMYRPLTTRR